MYAGDIILRFSVLALTPFQRFQALKDLDRFNDDRDFIRYCLIAIVILLAILFVVSFRRINRDKKTNRDLFSEYAEQRDLTSEELKVLQKIIKKSGLRQAVSIFSMISAFDKGSEKIKKELFISQNGQELLRLEPIFSSLRQKLGFQRGVSFSRGLPGTSEKVSSRQIPLGKELVIERQSKFESEPIKASVIRNTDNELAIQLSRNTTIIFGESWKVRYFFGSSIWEFEAFVTSYNGDIMVLSHSDDVHFINRRRFMRAPVNKQALIAIFPFEKNFKQSVQSTQTNGNYPEIPLQPLQFVPALVTEFGGPGLKIETSMQVEQGDRILVMFELERNKEQSSTKNQETEEIIQTYTSTLKVIENVGMVQEAGIVRRMEDNSDIVVIGVELIGLRDSDIDCLIRATNEASLNNNGKQTVNAEENAPAQMNV